jgi:hypothetical protein
VRPTIVGLDLREGGGVLGHFLEALVRQDVDELRAGRAPRLLPRPGQRPHIVYKRERTIHGRALERWQTAAEVARRGEGDCEDLAAYWAAELRVRGIDPRAKVQVIKTGPALLHAVVLRSDGRIDDPSRWLGMKGKG